MKKHKGTDTPIYDKLWTDFWKGRGIKCGCGCGKYVVSPTEFGEDYVFESWPPRCSKGCGRYITMSDFLKAEAKCETCVTQEHWERYKQWKELKSDG